ncbi:MAG: alpha/beta hydrolase [Eubacteriales bacterium]|nr:alpha/beta hydrolase [Eubacteriales bacterium]MDD3349347.1 alpha/beta hydrolase [Eubacteriales bacterium]
MNKLKKAAFKALSYPYIDVKKDYKLQRKVHRIANPYIKRAYHVLDRQIMVEGREIPVRVFPVKKQLQPGILLFFHGGGWVTGDIESYTKVCANMAKQTGRMVISVDYRLAPENPFPAGLEDCYHVARELFLHLELVHCRQDEITLIGYSAGANLAAAISLLAKERAEFMPEKQILICPATFNNHSSSSPFASVIENGFDYILTSQKVRDYLDLYVKTKEQKDSPLVAPLLAEDLLGQPKTLIITAEYDPLRDEGEAYGKKLKAFGNQSYLFRIKDAVHSFFTLPLNTDAIIESYDIINHFLDKTNGCDKENR